MLPGASLTRKSNRKRFMKLSAVFIASHPNLIGEKFDVPKKWLLWGG